MNEQSKTQSLTHFVRSKTGGMVEIGHYTRGKAIRLACTECMGFQGGLVAGCTDTNCPLFPYRKATHMAYGAEQETTT